MKLSQQVAVVTGGGSGIGKQCVDGLLQDGIKAVAWDLEFSHTHGHKVICDVTSESSVEQALNYTIKHFGVPRIGINCAGIASAFRVVGKNGRAPLSAFREVVNVNLMGTFNVISQLVESMQALDIEEEECGLIINTASIAAYEGQIGQAAYSASKGGVVSLTLPLARELARDNIRIMCIAPGLIDSPMLSGMADKVQKHLLEQTVFPSRFGDAYEFYLLAKHIIENKYLNGEVIRLDGAIRLSC